MIAIQIIYFIMIYLLLLIILIVLAHIINKYMIIIQKIFYCFKIK